MSSLNDQIINVLSQSDIALSSREIGEFLNPPPAQRTLQRYIRVLVRDGSIEAIGKGAARRYRLPQHPERFREHQQFSLEDKYWSFIPIGEGAKEVVKYVQRPVAARVPVGYELDFLASYKPNETFYLSEASRKPLYFVISAVC